MIRAAIAAAPLALGVLPPGAVVCQEGSGIPHEDDLPGATLVEVLELDMRDAPLAGGVMGLAESSDGTVFVGGSTEVLVFDPDGTYRGEIGRPGEGPGEFRALTAVGMHRDTLWAADAMSRRVTRFLPDGSLLDVITPPRSMVRIPSLLTLATDGSVFGKPLSPVGFGDADGSDESLFTVWWRWRGAEGAAAGGPDAAVADTLIEIEVGDALMNIEVRGSTLPLPQPFVAREFVAVAGTEPYGLAAHASRRNDDGLIVVERLRFGGVRDTAFAVRYRPRRITAEYVDDLVDRMGVALASPFGAPERAARPDPDIARRLRRAIHVPDYHPPLSDLIQGSGGSMWIGREASPSGREWLVVPAGVEAAARITLADDQQPLASTADYVWIFEFGSFDLPRITKYRLQTG